MRWMLTIAVIALVLLPGCALLSNLARSGVETDSTGEAVRDVSTAIGTAVTGSSYAGEIIGGVVLGVGGILGLVKYKRKKSSLEEAVGLLVETIEYEKSPKAIKRTIADAENKEIETIIKKINGDL